MIDDSGLVTAVREGVTGISMTLKEPNLVSVPGENEKQVSGDSREGFAVIVTPRLRSEEATPTVAVWSGRGCAVHGGGGVRCWGGANFLMAMDRQEQERLYTSQYTGSPIPVEVAFLAEKRFIQMDWSIGELAPSAGCGVTGEGAVYCWTGKDRQLYQLKGFKEGIRRISVGDVLICGIKTSGGLRCGTFTLDEKYQTFVDADEIKPVAVSVGRSHACFVSTEGSVYCAGDNSAGQVGVEPSTTSKAAKELGVALDAAEVHRLDEPVADVCTGAKHTCALTRAGGVKCWGGNEHGQLGDGTTDGRWVPATPTGLESGISAIGCGGSNTCALTEAGGVMCWGFAGMLPPFAHPPEPTLCDGIWEYTEGGFKVLGGNGLPFGGFDRTLPSNIPSLESGIAGLTAAEDTLCARRDDGRITCWGVGIFPYDVSGFGPPSP